MSLCIRVVSKAKFVDCSGYVDEEAGECCDHKRIESFPLGQEGLKTGCYVPGKGGAIVLFRDRLLGLCPVV